MKKFIAVLMLVGMFTMTGFAQETKQEPAKDGAYYVGKVGSKIGRVSYALGKSIVNGAFHVGKDVTVSVAPAVAKGAVHAGKDVVHAGKAVVTDVKK